MNSHTSTLILVFLLITVLLGCTKDNPESLKNQSLAVINTQFSDCKNNTKLANRGEQQYILLKAVNRNQLKLTFVNAVLNCCPGEIVTNAAIKDNILEIHFNESMAMCDCICPYDLECIIDEMENRKYDIEIYAGGYSPDAKFSFTFSRRLNMKFDITD